ncbi:polyamine aminopropyltransferase [Fibrella sp. WM1]|uniref:polyamine aminopropyltransferase n=1 Tax=Fibrella musci TaxID=3242485 RepID=UPI003520C34B
MVDPAPPSGVNERGTYLPGSRGRLAPPRQWLLLLAVFVIATCGLIYELIAGTLASYLLGDSVTQFSTIIGVYLFSMGIGSWLSKFVEGNLLRWFIRVELLVGLVGGFSAPLLFVLFEYVASFRLMLYSLVGLTGILVGLEIPLLMRILEDQLSFKELVSKVFTFDYIGALLASLIFPLVLVPYLGLVRSSVLFGLLNVGVAGYLLAQFAETRPYRRSMGWAVALSVLALLAAFIGADRIVTFAETATFRDTVIFSKNTPYQRLVLTRNAHEMRLYLNGNLQFSSVDEYRYHEALVHPAMRQLPQASRVLVLGGGDGLAVRELLRYPHLRQIDLVDLDPAMTRLFRQNTLLTTLNANALNHAKVRVWNDDAYNWVRTDTTRYDLIVMDFPDPSNYSVGKLYSTAFYRELPRLLRPGGRMVVQSTSPFMGRRSFWCIVHTLQAVGFQTQPYHAYVPSFGEWGYVLAYPSAGNVPGDPFARATGTLPAGLRYVNAQTLGEMGNFPPDMAELPTDVNRLNNQVLVRYFEEDWGKWQ